MTGGPAGERPDDSPEPTTTPRPPTDDTDADDPDDDAGADTDADADDDTDADDADASTEPPSNDAPAMTSDVAAATDDDADEPETEIESEVDDGPALGESAAEAVPSGERYDEGFAARSGVGAPAVTAYRSTDDRNRSVYRRANPWYRRLARGVIAACLIAGLALGAYYGARAIQDYLNRERLPSAAPDIPEFRETSIVVVATTPEIQLEGTLTFDTQTLAFEFVGAPDSPNATDRLTSPDGQTVLQQGTGSTWIELADTNELATNARRAVRVLAGSSTADVVLTNRIRAGYVELIRQIDEGEDDDIRTRYDVRLDLTDFARDFPLQWDEFRADSVPGVTATPGSDMSMWLDDEDVLVQFSDEETGWNWQRIERSPAAYTPTTPEPGQIEGSLAPGVTTVVCTVPELGLTYNTGLGNCDNAEAVGGQYAVEAGLGATPDDPAAQLAFVSVCTTIQGDDPVEYEDEAYVTLADQLDAALVCPGDTDLVVTAGTG